ncbi:MAG: hypothetical protein IJA32_12545 [Lachnospiraceae bacterium]|nr:hypothetical protein [Lachnospiraceae bacterium]
MKRGEYDRAVMLLQLGCTYAKDYPEYGENENIFWKLCQLYVQQEKFENAYKVVCQIPSHTKMDWLKKTALDIIERMRKGDTT